MAKSGRSPGETRYTFQAMGVPSLAARMRVLLVEDQALVARAVARLLRTHGCTVEVIDRCAALPTVTGTFDLGLFDIDLPDGNGVDLAEAALGAGQVSVALFYTGTTDRELLSRAAQLGPVVSKTHAPSGLLETMRATVSAHLRAMVATGQPLPGRNSVTGVRRRVPR